MFIIGMLVFLCVGCIILGAWQMHHSKKLNRILDTVVAALVPPMKGP